MMLRVQTSGLHGLSGLVLQCRQWKMVKSQNKDVHIWNLIVDTFMIFTSMYVLASLSVMKTHRGPKNS